MPVPLNRPGPAPDCGACDSGRCPRPGQAGCLWIRHFASSVRFRYYIRGENPVPNEMEKTLPTVAIRLHCHDLQLSRNYCPKRFPLGRHALCIISSYTYYPQTPCHHLSGIPGSLPPPPQAGAPPTMYIYCTSMLARAPIPSTFAPSLHDISYQTSENPEFMKIRKSTT